MMILGYTPFLMINNQKTIFTDSTKQTISNNTSHDTQINYNHEMLKGT